MQTHPRKAWFEDRLVGTFNYTVEPEWEKAGGESSYETNLQMNGARAFPTALHRTGTSAWKRACILNSPTPTEQVEFSSPRSSGRISTMDVATGGRRSPCCRRSMAGRTHRGKGGLQLDEHERFEVRLKVGFNF